MAWPMEPAAEGCWAEAEDKLGKAIANCPAAQAFLGVANDDEALRGNLYLHAMDPPDDDESYQAREFADRLPAIIVATPGDDAEAVVFFRRSHPNDFGPTGNIEIRFHQMPKADESIGIQERLFQNAIGAILTELQDRSDREGFLTLNNQALATYGREMPENVEDVLGEMQTAIVIVTWGDVEGEE